MGTNVPQMLRDFTNLYLILGRLGVILVWLKAYNVGSIVIDLKTTAIGKTRKFY